MDQIIGIHVKNILIHIVILDKFVLLDYQHIRKKYT